MYQRHEGSRSKRILLSLSIWRKHENEVLKKKHIQSHEESSSSRSPQYSQKNTRFCMYFSPIANCIRYIKVAQVQIHSI